MKKLFTPKTLHQIDLGASPQVRAKVRRDIVDEYFELYESKAKLPEVVLFEVAKDRYLVADGMHRVSAMMQFPEISKWAWTMDVRKGDYVDCLRFALKANLGHGLRRSNEDKRQSVVTALKEFPKTSNVQLAEIAAVSDTLVGEIRKELTNSNAIPKTEKTTGKDGRERTSTSVKPRLAENKPNKDGHFSEVDSEPARVVAGPPVFKDVFGITVPSKAMPIWERRLDIENLMRTLSDIKCIVEKALKSGDKLFVEVGNSTLANLMMVRQEISYALPYTVCPNCNGQLIEKCSMCRGRGCISKELYGTVPAEIRAMREKGAKKK